MEDSELTVLADLAEEAARAAGAELLRRFRRTAEGVSTKVSPTDMVSDADRAAEQIIVDVIRAARPHDAFLGEESGSSRGTSGVLWIVDPLDGTTNYLYGLPTWAVSIAADVDGRRVAGIVHVPVGGETFRAVAGAGTTCDGEPAHVSDCDDLAVALVATGFHYRPELRARQGRFAGELLEEVRDIRRFGAAALDLALVAVGRLDGFYEAPLGPWDFAAGSLLVVEAGGAVRPLQAVDGSGAGVIAAGPALIDALDRRVNSPDVQPA